MSKHLRTAHSMLAVLMLLMLVLPIPWVSYGSGHYVFGYFFVFAWVSFSWQILISVLTLQWGGSYLRVLRVVNWAVFAVGYVFVAVFNLLSARRMRSWLKRTRRTLVVVTLLSASVAKLMQPSYELLVGFWLAVGLVGVTGLVELAEYVVSRGWNEDGLRRSANQTDDKVGAGHS